MGQSFTIQSASAKSRQDNKQNTMSIHQHPQTTSLNYNNNFSSNRSQKAGKSAASSRPKSKGATSIRTKSKLNSGSVNNGKRQK